MKGDLKGGLIGAAVGLLSGAVGGGAVGVGAHKYNVLHIYYLLPTFILFNKN